MIEAKSTEENPAKQEDFKFDPETQRMIDAAEALVASATSQMSLKQLFYFNGYLHKVKDDYDAHYHRWIRRKFGEDDLPPPRYRKLPGSEGADWWPIVEPLFAEDGGKYMSGLVESFLERHIHEVARANPWYVPEAEYPDVQHIAHSVAVQEAEEGTKLDLIGTQIKNETDPAKLAELGQQAAQQQKVVDRLTSFKDILETKPLDLSK